MRRNPSRVSRAGILPRGNLATYEGSLLEVGNVKLDGVVIERLFIAAVAKIWMV